MKLYELTYLLSPELSTEELNSFQEKLITLLQEQGGILTERSKLVKRNLPQPIKKKEWVVFGFLNFQIDKEKLTGLEKKLKAEKQILRSFIASKSLSKKAAKPFRRAFLPKKLIKPKKEKVEIKDFEKKLEEILKE